MKMSVDNPELNQILMCYEKHVWAGLGCVYPVVEQKRMTRSETIAALETYYKAQASKDIAEVIGTSRQYLKYEPCPRCGIHHQYACSCDVAEELLIADQRKTAEKLGYQIVE